jgi:aspartate kinase
MTNKPIVAKFGGTSVADANQLRKVEAIVKSDPRRRVIVPSAPGKRVSSDPKVTDLLYLCHEMATMDADLSGPFGTIRERFLTIERDLGLPPAIEPELDALLEQLRAGCTRDFAASRGEYLSGRIVAALLGATFVDPADVVRIRSNGSVDPVTYELLGSRLSDPTIIYVVPGFYGSDSQGRVKTFSRGGSDISGAIAARAANAELYENWTDVSGLLMADPRIVPSPLPMLEVTYREIRELSYMGASVFHDEAILPVREAGIPICIKNTNAPNDPGTRIVTKLSPEVENTTEIAGIAGKKGFAMLGLEKSLMNKEVGFAYRLLGIMERHGISVEHCPSSIDGINVIMEAGQLGDRGEALVDEVRRVLQPDRVELSADLALIAVVGEGMAKSVGIAAKVFNALRDSGVNVRVINQGASELNIIIGVAPEDFENAVRALYDAFMDSGRKN